MQAIWKSLSIENPYDACMFIYNSTRFSKVTTQLKAVSDAVVAKAQTKHAQPDTEALSFFAAFSDACAQMNRPVFMPVVLRVFFIICWVNLKN